MERDSVYLAAEIGGTFTDIMLLSRIKDKNVIRTLKIPSTPRHPELGVLAGFDALNLDWTKITKVLHGSTVGTNAVLERKGVATAFLVTEGFRDLLEIQRGDKENIYDIFYQRTPPLVPRYRVYGVTERITAAGEILKPLDRTQVHAIAKLLREQGIEAVAICFLHSYKNPEHELLAKRILEAELPDALILASAEILPQFREYERASTTVMSAYIAPVMASYVENLKAELAKRGFKGGLFITQSNGGTLPAPAIRREVVRTLLSGPAAGVTGAVYVAAQVNEKNIITLDMGGTSTDVCLITGGKPQVTTENRLNGLPVAVPMIDIVSVGAGGGSLAWLDRGNMLRVGPQSAGADPGPACYGRGGMDATVTDALVYMGYIRVDNFVGGKYKLDKESCNEAICRFARSCNLTPEQAAEAIVRIVEDHMAHAVKVVSTQRGHDPRLYTLVAFGGAGPVHAVKLAEELGIEKVLIPRHAGLLSAFGLLVANVMRDYVQTDIGDAAKVSALDIETAIEKLKRTTQQEFQEYLIPWERVTLQASADLRYKGQAFDLNIPFDLPAPDGKMLAERFHQAHQDRYGHSSNHEPVEIVNYRLQAVVKEDIGDLRFPPADGTQVEQARSKVYMNGQWLDCTFIKRDTLAQDSLVKGPAVIEEETSTCVVYPGWEAAVLGNGSLMLTRSEEARR